MSTFFTTQTLSLVFTTRSVEELVWCNIHIPMEIDNGFKHSGSATFSWTTHFVHSTSIILPITKRANTYYSIKNIKLLYD